MSILSRQTLERLCYARNLVRRQDDKPLKIEPVSIDLHLSEVDLDGQVHSDGTIVLRPGVFCLGNTIETFAMPDFLVGFVVGKSTNAREGLQIEAAGLIDPGFFGDITLELKNLHHEEDIRLVVGEPIGQVYFIHLDEPTNVLYGPGNGNHYQGQRGVTRSHRK